jgi:hypothetical protein
MISVTEGVAMTTRDYPYHHECRGFVAAPVEQAFRHLDDPARLSAHMSRSSWRMAGSRMDIRTDDGHGQEIGSHIRMAGRMLGIALSLDEVVTERQPPRCKAWEIVGTPKLLVIGQYRMGFDLQPLVKGSTLRVFIDYALPDGPVTRWLGRLLGPQYARWCTQQMLDDAVGYFFEEALARVTLTGSEATPLKA